MTVIIVFSKSIFDLNLGNPIGRLCLSVDQSVQALSVLLKKGAVLMSGV